MGESERAREHRRSEPPDESANLVPPEVSVVPVSPLEGEAAGTAAGGYSMQQIGNIVSIATRLQMETERQGAASVVASHGQLVSLAKDLGLDEEHLDRAIALSRRELRTVLLHGDLKTIRSALIERFSQISYDLRDPQSRLLAPRVVQDGNTTLTVEWGDARLALELRETGGGKTEVVWNAKWNLESASREASNWVFGTLAAGPALVFAGMGAVLGACLWPAGILATVAGGRYFERLERARASDRFEEFCERHMENLQLLSVSRESAR